MSTSSNTDTPLTAEDRKRVQGIREMVDAAGSVDDLAALWSAEADFLWLLRKAESTLDARATSLDAVIGRCGCTIHDDRDEPCGFTAPLSDYMDPLSQVCDTCMRVCWGWESDALGAAWEAAEKALQGKGGDWSVAIVNAESGDGYFEPHYEAYRAVATLGLAFPQYAQTVTGSTEGDVAAALLSLSARLSAGKEPGG